jgi:hypothetical protein
MVAKIIKVVFLPAALFLAGATSYAQTPLPDRGPVATDPDYAPGGPAQRNDVDKSVSGRGRGINGPRPGDRDPTDRVPPTDSNGAP